MVLSNKEFDRALKNIRPLQVYKLNNKEAFSVSKINLLEEKAYGSVIPLEYINEKFVLITRFESIDIRKLKPKFLLKDFHGYWDGRYWD